MAAEFGLVGCQMALTAICRYVPVRIFPLFFPPALPQHVAGDEWGTPRAGVNGLGGHIFLPGLGTFWADYFSP